MNIHAIPFVPAYLRHKNTQRTIEYVNPKTRQAMTFLPTARNIPVKVYENPVTKQSIIFLDTARNVPKF